ncbi:type II secretion system F family protein [Crystallibacter crystallopoietes]|uniref:type II secretion system F family protein n=1 Tax=Crystallibacter crystallopoietes TaxID=37928 RepID=UPI0002E8E886|nr:type II secretion system F family protein [Arthrobacter crystallopoietes]
MSTSPVLLVAGLVLSYSALGLVLFMVLSSRSSRLSTARRRAAAVESVTMVSRATAWTTAKIEEVLARRKETPALAGALDSAGLKFRPAELVVFVAAGSAMGGAVGLLMAGPLMGLLLAVVAPMAAKVVLGTLANRRRSAFAEQLDDSLQLLSSGLRAGHSLLRAIDAVSADSPSPTSEEFTRIINETRLGRDLGESLNEAARRMRSDDFSWVAQAIAVHREVGGNLAEVLDRVGQTIRERNQIRGQVKALSAEGRISAIVLMVLPFGLGGFLLVASPGYMNAFTESPLGYLLIGVSGLLLVTGGLWLRKVVSFKF